MSLQRTSGVIIKISDYGESDKIVTLYCPIEGKIALLAKGAMRSQKRFVNKLELFSFLDIQYNLRYRFALLEQADLLNGFSHLREDFTRYAAAGLLCEHLLQWSSENDGDNAIFIAFLNSLNAINNSGPIQKTLVLFLIHLYSRLGYQPDLSGCSQCGTLDPAAGPFQFRSSYGTIICKKCFPVSNSKYNLSMPTIKLISQAQKLSFPKTSRLQFPSASITQALHLFQAYGNFLLDRKLNSWEFIDFEGK